MRRYFPWMRIVSNKELHCICYQLIDRTHLQATQTISLTANLVYHSDPTYFRLATLRKAKESKTKLKYIDIDYPTLIAERLYMVRTQDTLRSLLPQNPTVDDVGEIVSDTYSCLGIDLRNLEMLKKGLEAAGVVPGLPVLVVSEVVLSYLEAAESDAVIKFFAAYPDGN